MPKGIDVRESNSSILIRASLKDTNSDIVTTGSTALFLYELQNDSSLKSFDFADNTFKTTATTLGSGLLQHRTALNGTKNTGIWGSSISVVSGFTNGNVYIAQIYNSNAIPPLQEREFCYGNGLGDLIVSGSGGVRQDFNQAVPLITGASGTMGDVARASLAQGFGKWVQTSTRLDLYNPEGTQIIRTFTLDSATSPSSRT